MRLFRESRTDDEARTGRLLDQLDDAYATRTGDVADGGELTEFEETILFGVANDPARPYPPAGHTYPRRR